MDYLGLWQNGRFNYEWRIANCEETAVVHSLFTAFSITANGHKLTTLLHEQKVKTGP